MLHYIAKVHFYWQKNVLFSISKHTTKKHKTTD